MPKKIMQLTVCALLCVLLAACGRQKAELLTSARPPFGQVGDSSDEGIVKPLASKINRPLKIAVLGLENNPFWIPVKEGVLKAGEELKEHNCQVDWIVPAGESHGASVFGTAIESAVVQGYDAIATVAGDSGIVPFIDRAVDGGVPVATFNSETETENKRLFFVGADLYQQGQVAGEHMSRLLDGKGNVAVITGFFSVEAHELRRKGFLDKLKEIAPQVVIVGEVENQDRAKDAYDQTKDFLTAHPDLAGLYVTAGGPFGAAKAIEDAGKSGVVKVICYDFVDETMAFVKKGVITGTIGQNPFAQGHDPVVRLYNYLASGEVPAGGKLLTRADFVTKENIDQFWQEKK